MRINIKKIFYLALFGLISFASINSYKAKEALSCNYTNSNGSKVNVSFYDDFKKPKAKYISWNNSNVSDPGGEDVKNYSEWYINSRNWDKTIYDRFKSSNDASSICPDMIWASHSNDNYEIYLMSKNNEYSTPYSNTTAKNNAQKLTLSGSNKSVTSIPNPKEINFNDQLLFGLASNTSPSFSDMITKKGDDVFDEKDGIEAGKDYYIYIVSSSASTKSNLNETTIKKGYYMNPDQLTCSLRAGNDKTIEILDLTFDSNYPNNSFAYLHVKTTSVGTKNTNATDIVCTYRTDSGENYISTFQINNPGADANSAKIKDLVCEPTVEYKESNGSTTKLGKVKVVINDYNDGGNVDARTTRYYTDENGEHELSSAQTPFKIGSNQIKWDDTDKTYVDNALNAGVGVCPQVYVNKKSGVYHLSTKAKGQSNGDSGDGYELIGNGCAVIVTNTANKNIGTVTFYKYKNEDNKYKYAWKTSHKADLNQMGTSITSVSRTMLYYEMGESDYVSFDKDSVDHIYSTYESNCNYSSLCYIPSESVDINTGNLENTYNFTTDIEKCSQSNARRPGENGGGGGSGTPGDLEIDDFGTDSSENFCNVLFRKVDGSNMHTGEYNEFYDVLKTGILAIRIAIPVLLIIMSMTEFIKAIAAADDDAIVKAKRNTVTRLIVAVIIFLLPSLIKLLFTLAQFDTCADIF